MCSSFTGIHILNSPEGESSPLLSMNRSDFHHTRSSPQVLPCIPDRCHAAQHTLAWQCNVLRIHANFERPLQKGLLIISNSLHCGFRHQGDQFLSGHIVISYVCFSGHLAGCCACASPGEILYIL